MSQAGRTQALERATPAGARPDELSFGQMLQRANVLAKTELVPKALQGKPEAIVLVGAKGAELGVPFIASLTDIHVIEGSASPSAQLRLALLRRAGHEARFVESSDEKAVIRGRRREYRGDPDAWVTVTWTIDQARRAGLLDVTHERWVSGENGRRRPMRWVEGSTPTPPDWIAKSDVEIKRRENWWRFPAEMLRARAASALCRMEFSDVLSGLGVDTYTPEEHGLDVGQDLDSSMAADQDDDVADAELVDDLGEIPRTNAPTETISAFVDRQQQQDEGDEAYSRRRARANAVMGEIGVAGEARHAVVLAATQGATQSTGRLTHAQVEAVAAYCGGIKTAAAKLAAKMSEGEKAGDSRAPSNAPSDSSTAPAEAPDNDGEAGRGSSSAPGPAGSGDRLPDRFYLRAAAKRAGVKDAQLLIQARQFAAARDLPLPETVADITDEQVAADLIDWMSEPA